MKLFTSGKTPLYCEAIGHRLEKRKSGDTKVVDLTLTIDPFTSQQASALDAEYTFVKRLLFKQTDATPTRDLKSAQFAAPGPRQLLTIFATPDSPKASIAIDQVKVTSLRVRGAKDGDRWVFVLKLCFGPVGRSELEFCNGWYTEQRFVTFEAADPSLFADAESENAGDEDDDDEEETGSRKGASVAGPQPGPMFDDNGKELAAGAADDESARHKLHSHAGGKGSKKTH